MEPAKERVAPGKRRWIRMSLRTFLILFTAVALSVAWFGRYAQQRMSAFDAIRKAGGEINMGIGAPSRLEQWFGSELFGTVIGVDLRNGNADNKLLQQIGMLQELHILDLSGAQIDDEGLKNLGHLPLTKLWLQGTNITDNSANVLSQISSLRTLHLNGLPLSDQFLQKLASLPELNTLSLRGTKVTGQGLKHISRHPNLSRLDLYHNEIQDAGVENLVDCQSLTDLGLSMTSITDLVFTHLDKLANLNEADLTANPSVSTAAVLEFEKTHPKCDIEWYRK